MTLEVYMVGRPKPGEFVELRRAGRNFGVTTVADWSPMTTDDSAAFYALETWRGPKAVSLTDFVFPERTRIIMGTTNMGLDPAWQEITEGSLYIPSKGLLTAPMAGAIVMYEWSKQQGGAR